MSVAFWKRRFEINLTNWGQAPLWRKYTAAFESLSEKYLKRKYLKRKYLKRRIFLEETLGEDIKKRRCL